MILKGQFHNIWGNPQIAKSATIGAFVDIGDDVVIGKMCKIQCFVSIPPGIRIGDNVFIGPKVTFTNDKQPKANGEWENLITTVENDVSIGAAAVILPGLTLGKGCMIGAGAVVTKNIPAGETWVGNPARRLK